VQIRLTKGKVALRISMILMAASSFAQAPAKALKDAGEGEIVQAIQKETDAKKRLQLIDQWKEKYPTSDFKSERAAAKLATAQQAQDATKTREAATELIEVDQGQSPASMQAYAVLIQFGMKDQNAAEVEQNAQKMLSAFDTAMADDKKPTNLSPTDWATQKKQFRDFALKSPGDAAAARKDFVKAEAEYTKALQASPNNAMLSQLLATSIIQQRKPEKQATAMWHYARSAELTGEGALADADRQKTKAFVEKNYVAFHGSRDGLDDLFMKAKESAFPPEGFKIESKLEIEAKSRDELMKTNPMLGKWLNLKDLLSGADGEAKFASDVKDTNAGGPYKGKLISATPESKPKELVLSISDGLTPEVTLKFDTALPGKAEPGIELEFDGTATAFTKDPFNLTFDVDAAKLTGWPKAAPAPKKTAPRRAAPKKG
jgi:hypothetical protein